MGGQRHALAASPPGNTQYPLYKRNLASTEIRPPDRLARSESLYRLSYPGPGLLHNGNNLPSVPLTHAANMKQSYENIELLLENIQYEKQN